MAINNQTICIHCIVSLTNFQPNLSSRILFVLISFAFLLKDTVSQLVLLFIKETQNYEILFIIIISVIVTINGPTSY